MTFDNIPSTFGMYQEAKKNWIGWIEAISAIGLNDKELCERLKKGVKPFENEGRVKEKIIEGLMNYGPT